VYPEILGKNQGGINETRRVTQSAAILEALNYVERKEDTLGGVVWIGRDIFKDWSEKQLLLYSDESMNIGRLCVRLTECELVTKELLEQGVDATRRFLDSVNAEPGYVVGDLSTEQQKSVANLKISCKCGITKKMEAIEGKQYSKKAVYTGFKKKTRCKNCPGCLAKKCKQCQFCLIPRLKKSCMYRVCQFPVVPKCPCFA